MLNQKRVFEELAKHGVTFFTGVPDSYLNRWKVPLDTDMHVQAHRSQVIISQAKRFLWSICRIVGWEIR